MAKTVDQLVIEIKAETKKLRKGLDQVNRSLDKTQKKSTSVATSMKGLGRLFAVIGAGAAVKGIVNTARTFEDLEATLRAVTGSTENAALAMQTVVDFTKTTPFQLKNVTEAFIRFFQAGIEPNAENLKAFGNLAAGMGRDITQLAQATFNATTGEMEMLKAFGIKARQNAKTIEFEFEGVPVVLEKSREAVANYLMELGAQRFPTAMEERLNTLSGAFANVQDQSAIAADTIGKGGLTAALTRLAKTISGELAGTADFAESLGFALGLVVDAFRVLGSAVVIVVDIIKGAWNMVVSLGDIVAMTFLGIVKGVTMMINAVTKPIQDMVNKAIDAYNSLPFTGNTTEHVDFQISTEKAEQQLEFFKKRLMDRVKGMPTPEEEVMKTATGSIAPPTTTKASADGLISMKEAFTDMQPAIIETTNAFANDFVGALLDGENAMDSFKNFAKDMVSQIIAAFMQMMVIKPIMDAIFKGFGLDVTPSAVDTSAGGGTVQPRKPVIVGERGAEVFIPNTGGTIMNNMNSRNMGGGTPVIVNQSVNFSTGVVPTVRAEVQKMMPMISDVTKGAVLEAAMRGGSFRKGLQGGG